MTVTIREILNLLVFQFEKE
jgi:hypothetical protein